MTAKNRKSSYCVTLAIGFLVNFLILSQLSELQFVKASPRDNEIVERWADEFGYDLYHLALFMTKATEIRDQYEANTARVQKGQNANFLANISQGLKRMLKLKINAVRCIGDAAEKSHRNYTIDFEERFDSTKFLNEEFRIKAINESFENQTYYSSKYSNITGREPNEDLENYRNSINVTRFRNMTLEQDTHFYNISVNVTHSSMHVPINIFDGSFPVLMTMNWTDALDKQFVDNYRADPALSWQYFGSEIGIARHFPAKAWKDRDTESGVDVYDCRKRSWYIETATCSKDVVILLDNSGSMYGFKNFLAQLTIKSILDTFSNNDFVNIYLYANEITEMIPCFKDSLVQATPENIEVFNEAAKYLRQQGYANEKNITNAFKVAFDLLGKYRTIRNCTKSENGCNQAIMLITDGVLGNMTKDLEQLNKDDTRNDTHKPVRIFTYQLGKEATKVDEIREMACKNRGNFSHIQTLDEVQGEVLKYVSNIAAPLVLQAKEHPPTWTHAFKDVSYTEEIKTTKPRLMIAVGVPAFNTVERNDSVPNPDLLGVASTDVPIDDIEKMALPYKLGVNGYAFIVSNNGYVILHPDLRPNANQPRRAYNYNSIDFTEVEQFYDEQPPRMPGEKMIQLRRALVGAKTGSLSDVPVKFHYDDRKRVAIQNYDYWYAPLPETPFSLGLAIPTGYGSTFIEVGDQVSKLLNNGTKLADYFVGENWKLHPEWVYCKYHYLEGHEFDNPEMEFSHFLKKLQDQSWEWSNQYDSELDSILNKTDKTPSCGHKTFEDNDYYCNKELVQSLIFDAKVTNKSYGQWKFSNKDEEEVINRYNATLRYVATMSGLTRWQFIFGEEEVDYDKEFGDFHNTAVDETWYKSAVLQHDIDPRSFVYYVPHDAKPDSEDKILRVSASHAIFPHDGGAEAPGCVVGFQFNHDLMTKQFAEITSKQKCPDCISCSDLGTDCYVIDNNGYIIISINQYLKSNYTLEVGKFFGEIQGDVMQALVDKKVFEMITIYDYQALCEEYTVTIETNYDNKTKPPEHTSTTTEKIITTTKCTKCDLSECWNVTESSEPIRKSDEKEARRKMQYRACDKKSNLYILEQNKTKLDEIRQSESITECPKPSVHHSFFFKLIPHSNLLLIVINKNCSNTISRRLSAKPEEIRYPAEFPCYKKNLNSFYRRPLEGCFTESQYEGLYGQKCNGTAAKINLIILVISVLLLITQRCFSAL